MRDLYDVIIVGSGPAGMTAALYTSRAKLRTLVMEKEVMGGELMNRDMIENYPGFPEGVLGPSLGSNMMTQCMNYGTELKFEDVTEITVEESYKLVKTDGGEYAAKGIIIAGGAHPKKLGVPGEADFIDRGVFHCATCDGPNFAGKTVAVAGGGDSGITEGLFLSKIVSNVIILEMLPACNATKVLQERALAEPNITINCGMKIEAILGDENVNAIEVSNVQDGAKSKIEVDGILVHIGIDPNTEYLKGTLPLDDKGQIKVNENLETEVPGIFAAVDIRSNSACQISTAVGDGAAAAMFLQRYLQRTG